MTRGGLEKIRELFDIAHEAKPCRGGHEQAAPVHPHDGEAVQALHAPARGANHEGRGAAEWGLRPHQEGGGRRLSTEPGSPGRPGGRSRCFGGRLSTWPVRPVSMPRQPPEAVSSGRNDGYPRRKTEAILLAARGFSAVCRCLRMPDRATPDPASHVDRPKNMRLEGKRMASGHTGNVVPGNRLWVRIPCPPLG